MAQLFVLPFIPAFGADGVLSPSATLTFYLTGTTTLTAVYADVGLTTPLANPLASTTGGQFPQIYLDPAITYRVVMKTAGGGVIDDADPVSGSTGATIDYIPVGPTAARDVESRLNERTSAWDNLSAAQIADVSSYAGTLDVTTPLNARGQSSWLNNRNMYVPAGNYAVTEWALPGTAAGRTKAFYLTGQGTGEIFARGFTGGTIIKGTSATLPVVSYTPDSPNTGQGTLVMEGFRIEGNTSAAAVNFVSLYSQSQFRLNSIFQAGVGDGLRVQLSNTSHISESYVINRDWNTTTLGGARVGVGVHITQSLAGGTGLTTVSKVTSRGFLQAYKIGNGVEPLYSFHMKDCEVSVSTNGIWLTASVRKAVVSNCYIEGGDGGTAILDEGQYTTICDNLIFSGFSIGIDAIASVTGRNIIGNVLSAGVRPNTTLLKIGSTGAGGGPANIVSGNSFVFGGSGGTIVGVVGIEISGIDPRITWDDNAFDPRGPWVGGAGTQKIRNISTSSDGTTGTGVYGMGKAQSLDLTVESPHLGRGAINLKVDGTVIGNSAIAAGVLTLGELSVFTMTLTGAANITSIVAPNLPDKTFQIHCTGGANLPTFVQGALLKMTGSVNFTPGANGSWHTFQVKPGGVVYETARVAY